MARHSYPVNAGSITRIQARGKTVRRNLLLLTRITHRNLSYSMLSKQITSGFKMETNKNFRVFLTQPLLFLNINTLNPELNPICYLLALLAHHFLHVSRRRVKSLTLRLLMSYIYGAPILDVSRSHTTMQHSR